MDDHLSFVFSVPKLDKALNRLQILASYYPTCGEQPMKWAGIKHTVTMATTGDAIKNGIFQSVTTMRTSIYHIQYVFFILHNSMMNFYQMNCTMNGEEPYELEPIDQNKLSYPTINPDFEEAIMQQQAKIQNMEVGDNMQTIDNPGEAQKIGTEKLGMSMRQQYEVDPKGNWKEI